MQHYEHVALWRNCQIEPSNTSSRSKPRNRDFRRDGLDQIKCHGDTFLSKGGLRFRPHFIGLYRIEEFMS